MEYVSELIRVFVDPNSEKRPTMNEVSETKRTKMSPDFTVPKLSPLHFDGMRLRFFLHNHVELNQ